MGLIPTSSKSKPSKRRLANVVTIDEVRAQGQVRNLKDLSKQKSAAAEQPKGRKRASSRKEITIARGSLREGALYDPSEGFPDEDPKLMRRNGADTFDATATQALSSEKNEQKRRPKAKDERKEARLKAKEEKKRARNKAKADKMFNASYDDAKSSGAANAASAEAGPRAALYKGEMGASQKKSTKLQGQLQGQSSSASYNPKRGFSIAKLTPRALKIVASVAIAAFCVVSLYGPAQQYYQQMRETDRLYAEYDAVAARTNDLQEQIDTLSTGAGIEDKAHEDLGYIKSGEQTAKVRGIKFEEKREFSSNVIPNSVPAPETWYSPVLDIVFGYSH